MKGWRQRAMVAVVAGGFVAGERHAVASAEIAVTGARLAPSTDGHLGAWLVAGPFDPALSPVEEPASPRLNEAVGPGGSAPRWRLASSNDGSLEVASAIESRAYAFAYAAGLLHVEQGGRHLLVLGGGDGLAVTVDGNRVFARDEP